MTFKSIPESRMKEHQRIKSQGIFYINDQKQKHSPPPKRTASRRDTEREMSEKQQNKERRQMICVAVGWR